MHNSYIDIKIITILMVLAFYDVYNKLPNWPPTHPLLVCSLQMHEAEFGPRRHCPRCVHEASLQAHSPKPPLRSTPCSLQAHEAKFGPRRHCPLCPRSLSPSALSEASSPKHSSSSSVVHRASLQALKASPKHSSKTSSSVVHEASPEQSSHSD